MYSIGFRDAAIKLYDFLGNMKKVSKALKCGVAKRHGQHSLPS